jgi:hypothetical protein
MLDNVLINLNKFLNISFCFRKRFEASNPNDVEGPRSHGIPVLGNDAIPVGSRVGFATRQNLDQRKLAPGGALQDALLIASFARVRQIGLDAACSSSEKRAPLEVAGLGTPDLDCGQTCAGQIRYLSKALLAV